MSDVKDPNFRRSVVVASVGERFVYMVRSDSNPRYMHRVDLMGADGFCECSCKDWQVRRWPAIKAGAKLGSPESLCKHGKAVRHKFLNEILTELFKQESEHAPRRRMAPIGGIRS